jgi:hypothetical protein
MNSAQDVVGTGRHHDAALDALGEERVIMTDEQVSQESSGV